jgi:hypothetical protein
MLKILGFSEKEITNFKTNTFKFVRALFKFLRKVLKISVIFDFTHDVFTREYLYQTPTFNVML